MLLLGTFRGAPRSLATPGVLDPAQDCSKALDWLLEEGAKGGAGLERAAVRLADFQLSDTFCL